jgi:hypothetical protein
VWDEALPVPGDGVAFDRQASPGASFVELPAGAARPAAYVAYGKALATHLYQHHRAHLWVCDAAQLVSRPDESEGDFRSRLALALREQRDARAEALRAKYEPKLTTLRTNLQRAGQKVERERSQLGQQKLQTAIGVGATVLGALFGRKALSVSTLGRATTAARSAGRLGRESQDVEHATDGVQQAEARIATLEAECQAALGELERSLDPLAVALREVELAPRKSDIQVAGVGLLWTPWRTGSDGFPQQAW